MAARGVRIKIKTKSDAQRRREYLRHVHAIGFRLVGEVFHLLPSVGTVVISAYSQRPDRATGRVRDDYLYSARIAREAWSSVNFDNLRAIDLPTSSERFDLRRKMTKTGIFKPVEPFEPESGAG